MGYYIGTPKKVLEKQKAHLQLKKHNYFNFAESKREAEECASLRLVSSQEETHEERQSHTYQSQHNPRRPTHPQVSYAFAQAPTHQRVRGADQEPPSQRTSYREYEVDASALKTDEGRGDRRNVQGELHASDEP